MDTLARITSWLFLIVIAFLMPYVIDITNHESRLLTEGNKCLKRSLIAREEIKLKEEGVLLPVLRKVPILKNYIPTELKPLQLPRDNDVSNRWERIFPNLPGKWKRYILLSDLLVEQQAEIFAWNRQISQLRPQLIFKEYIINIKPNKDAYLLHEPVATRIPIALIFIAVSLEIYFLIGKLVLYLHWDRPPRIRFRMGIYDGMGERPEWRRHWRNKCKG